MSSSHNPDGAKPLRCPICGKDAVERFRPFCSKRCADVDLGKWFSGAYVIASHSKDDEEDGEPEERGKGPEDDAQER
jgi:endogenous inhibitor of DNA gyrase (YacG/DUF329 family)